MLGVTLAGKAKVTLIESYAWSDLGRQTQGHFQFLGHKGAVSSQNSEQPPYVEVEVCIPSRLQGPQGSPSLLLRTWLAQSRICL